MKLDDHLYYYPEQGMLDCNTYVIKDERIMIVDVGLDKNLPSLIEGLKGDGIDPSEIDIIANTHLHMDHAWANEAFKEKFSARIEIAPVQKKFYDVGVRETSLFFNIEPIEFKEDGILDSKVNLGNIQIEVIETPGHSPDSVCFYCPQSKAILCGDLIFNRNTGRPDLPGGDMGQLEQSMEKIAKLDINLLLPGHMSIVEGEKAVKKNFKFIKEFIF